MREQQWTSAKVALSLPRSWLRCSVHDVNPHGLTDARGRGEGGPAMTAHASSSALPVIAFAKDWHEDPTSNHHVLRELARSRRVLARLDWNAHAQARQ